MSTVTEALQRPFPLEKHKTLAKAGGLTYIGIEDMLERLHEATNMRFSLTVTNSSLDVVAGESDKNGNPMVLARVAVRLQVFGLESIEFFGFSGAGVGAEYESIRNADKAIKTALANAIKKAMNTLGCGLYLWDEDWLAVINDNDTEALKRLAKRLGVEGNTKGEIKEALGL